MVGPGVVGKSGTETFIRINFKYASDIQMSTVLKLISIFDRHTDH